MSITTKLTGVVVAVAILFVLSPDIAANAAASGATAAGVSLRSVNVEFPSSDRALPPGENVEVVTNNCTACHSPGMILTQPKLTAAAWTAEVNKMRSTYKAPVPEDAVPQIVAYLAAMPVPQ